MAKVNLKKFESDMEKIIDAVADKQTMQEVGDLMAERIKTRTRLGRGVNKTGGPSVPLAPLKDSTVTGRKRKKQNGDLSSFTSPKRSNLTETGQLLDSFKVEASQGKVSIQPSGQRNDGQQNQDVAAFAEDGSSNRAKRKFLDLSGPELNAVQKLIRDKIEKILKRLTK